MSKIKEGFNETKNNFKMETVVTSSTERAKMPFPVIAESSRLGAY